MPFKSTYTIEDGYLRVTLVGSLATASEVIMMGDAIRRKCRDNGLRRALVDEMALAGTHDCITVHEVSESKEAELFAMAGIRVAVVGTADRLHEYHLYETFLNNRSLVYKAFLDEEEALQWLLK